MAKLKQPLIGFKAHGSLGNAITFQDRNGGTMVRKKPVPTDPRSDRQLWHRYLYRQACQYWQTLTAIQKQTWETNARPYHMSGFAYFMRAELHRLTNLVLCYPLDEGSGSAAIDFSGNLNHGIIYGAQWADGVINSCLYFDGVDDTVNCGHRNSISNPGNKLTIELWVYLSTVPGYQMFARKGGDKSYQFYAHATWYRFWLKNEDNVVSSAQVTRGAIGRFHHLIAEYDGSLPTQNIKIYEDNIQLVGTGNLTGNVKVTSDDLIFGEKHVTEYFKGYQDEIRMYNDVLTATEKTMHFLRRGSP